MPVATETAVQQLGRFASSLTVDNIPPEVLDKAKACLLNGLAVAVASRHSKHAAIAASVAEASPAAPGQGSTLLVNGKRVAAPEAAFGNGVLFHGENEDDSYHVAAHFGATILPVVLAIAELEGQSGADVLPAIVAGYEVSASLCRDHLPITIDRGWRGGPMYSMFGAAAAAGRLMRLDPEQLTNAIAFAIGLAFASVGPVVAHTMETPYQMGLATRQALSSAFLARAGVTANPQAIEGKVGWLDLFAGTFEHQDKITAELGRTWEIMNVTFKRYATSLRAHGPIYLALNLAREEEIDPAAIERIDLELSPFEFGYPGPGRRDGKDERVVYGTTGALIHRKANLEYIMRHEDPVLLDLGEKVAVRAADDLESLCVRLKVTTPNREYVRELSDGLRIHLFSFAELEQLLRSGERTSVPSGTSIDDLIGAIRDFETAPNVQRLIELSTP